VAKRRGGRHTALPQLLNEGKGKKEKLSSGRKGIMSCRGEEDTTILQGREAAKKAVQATAEKDSAYKRASAGRNLGIRGKRILSVKK